MTMLDNRDNATRRYLSLMDKVHSVLRAVFPTAHHIPATCTNVPDPADPSNPMTPIGREIEVNLIDGYATLKVRGTVSEGVRLVFGYNLNGSWREYTVTGPDLGDPNIENPLEQIGEKARDLATKTLRVRWEDLVSEELIPLRPIIDEAQKYADFHGEHLVFQWDRVATPRNAWRFGGCSHLVWRESSRAPRDGELCWFLSGTDSTDIRLVRLVHVPSDDARAVFMVQQVLERPKFDKGVLLLPEDSGKEPFESGLYGSILPRTEQTNLMARTLLETVSTLDRARARFNTIENVFGRILKPLLDKTKE